MVIALEPTSSGTVALHCVVPLAVPDCPVLVDQVIDVTPTLSLAVPPTAMVAAEVDTEVDAGVVMVSVGAVVSGPPPLAAPCSTIETLCETRLTPSVAVTTMVLVPEASGIAVIVQMEEPSAAPEP